MRRTRFRLALAAFSPDGCETVFIGGIGLHARPARAGTTAPVMVLLDGREASLDTRQERLAERYHPFPDVGDGKR